MPNLSCSVRSCSYNEDKLCCLSGIDVSGNSSSEDTCCSSYSDSPKNSNINTPHQSLRIDCDATDCAYNERHACYANHVDIRSHGEANNRYDTECATFIKNL